MNRTQVYVDLKGQSHPLDELDAEERELLRDLTERATRQADWNEFSNHWMKQVGDFYHGRGLSRQQTRQTVVYRVAQDLASRLAVRAGMARAPDYRDDLEELIRSRFATRRAFCEATGISEDMLSHVLARRKHLAIETLSDALQRIGYTLHIAPIEAKAS